MANYSDGNMRLMAVVPVVDLIMTAPVGSFAPVAVVAMNTGAIKFLEKRFDRETRLDHVRKALAFDAEWRNQDSRFEELANRVAQLAHASARN